MPRSNKPNKLNTSITVKRTTRNELNKLKKLPEEYLDSVISRLIKSYKEKKLI